MGVSGGASDVFKQKRTVLTFVLGNITGGNMQDGVGAGGRLEVGRLVVRKTPLTSNFASASKSQVPENKNLGYFLKTLGNKLSKVKLITIIGNMRVHVHTHTDTQISHQNFIEAHSKLFGILF